MLRLKKTLGLLIAGAIIFGISACGGTDSSSSETTTAVKANEGTEEEVSDSAETKAEEKETENVPSGDVAEVVFWDMMSGNESYPAAAEKQAAKITEEHPNIKITYQSIPWANRYETFTSAIAAQEAPDFSNGGGYQSFQFYAMGEIMDVTPLIDDWRDRGVLDNYNQSMIDYFQVDGAQVGIPTGYDVRLMIYRKDWFDEAGIDAPETWDDIYEAAKHFTDSAEGVYGLVYPCEGADGNVTFMMWPNMNGSGVWTEDGTNAAWDTPANIEMVEFIRKLNGEGLMPEGMSAYTNAEVIQMCAQDKAAMAIITTGNAGSQIAANDGYGKWAMLPTPAGPSANGNNAAVASMNAYMAYSQTDHPEETMTAMGWWAENFMDLMKDSSLGIGGVPARSDWQEDPEFLDNMADLFLKDYLLDGYMESTHTLVYPATNIKGWQTQNVFDAERWWSRLSQSILTTNTDAETLLKDMQDEAEAVMIDFDEKA